ncbi:MAG: hypothetical protein H6506_00425 [Calditrichaeota bacterium]|nr:hypothetical protein [Calditrichota bacterium]MCB9391101.1 hypothetical protein [Calditrichota bacterium]
MNLDRAIMAVLFSGLAVLYAAVILTFLEGTDPSANIFYLAALGVPFAIGFFAAPRVSLYVLGAFVYSIDWLAEYWGAIPREATWLIDILLLLFAARYGLTFYTAKHKFFTVEKLILVALVIALMSALINGLGASTTFIGLRVGFRYLFLFMAAAGLHPEPEAIRRFIKYLFVVGLVQTPIILWQWKFTNWISPDDLSGSFGRNQTPAIALFTLVLFAYMVANMLEDRKTRPLFIWTMFFMMPVIILGEVKFFFLILPLFVVFLSRHDVFKSPGTAILLGVVGVVMVVITDYVIVQTGFWREGRNPLTYVTKLPEIFQQELEPSKEGRAERAFRFVSAIRLAAESPKTALVGNGPGSITLSYVSANATRKSEYFAGFGLTSSAPTIPWMLIEYGYGGVFLFFCVLWFIFRRGKHLRLSENRDDRVLGRMLEGMVFLYVAWLFYMNTWQSDQMNFIFWPLAGMLVRRSYDVAVDYAYVGALARARAVRGPKLWSPGRSEESAETAETTIKRV